MIDLRNICRRYRNQRRIKKQSNFANVSQTKQKKSIEIQNFIVIQN